MKLDPVTEFYLAIKNNEPETIRKLVKSSEVDVDHCFKSGPSVNVAVESCSFDATKALLESGGSLGLGNSSRQTPLAIACRIKRPDFVKLLLENHAHPNICYDAQGWTPIHYAVDNRDGESLHLLLSYGADPDMIGLHGHVPLIMAILRRDLKSVETLVQFGASSDTQDPHGRSSFHYVASCVHDISSRHRILYKMLLAGANLRREAWTGRNSESNLQRHVDPETIDWLYSIRNQFLPRPLKAITRIGVRTQFGMARARWFMKQRHISPVLYDYLNYSDLDF